MTTAQKRQREKEVVELMIRLYCRRHHGSKALCRDCRELLEYAQSRSEHCPFMENKTFCSNCRVHCYKPAMREKIRRVMAYSGPRMIFYHPILALSHVYYSLREKRRLSKESS